MLSTSLWAFPGWRAAEKALVCTCAVKPVAADIKTCANVWRAIAKICQRSLGLSMACAINERPECRNSWMGAPASLEMPNRFLTTGTSDGKSALRTTGLGTRSKASSSCAGLIRLRCGRSHNRFTCKANVILFGKSGSIFAQLMRWSSARSRFLIPRSSGPCTARSCVSIQVRMPSTVLQLVPFFWTHAFCLAASRLLADWPKAGFTAPPFSSRYSSSFNWPKIFSCLRRWLGVCPRLMF
mmetsp:Transcript_77481/g.224825  ORF Transcript_77481/g.224825 Transcript_77481/m.224825 type:complete len:240 (+) Transcript_77481:1032-1751(+)